MSNKSYAMKKLLKLVNATEFNVFLAFMVVFIVFSILSPYFFALNNLLNIGIYVSIMGIMATGATMVLLTGGLDISQYATGTFSAVLATILLQNGVPTILAILVGLCVGAGLGLINGLLITKFRVAPVIATLSTMQIYRGFTYIMTNATPVPIDDPAFTFLGRGSVLGIPTSIIVMIVTYVVIWYILSNTPFGRKVYAIGGNPDASYLSGIKLSSVRLKVYLISGITASVACMLLMAQTGAGMPQAGTGNEMDVIAAVVLGGISLSGGKGNIIGTLIGALMLATLSNGFILLGIPSFWQMVARGLVLISAVLLDAFRGGGYK